MCSSKPKPPKVVVRDPVADAAKAANDAQREANAATATRRKKLRSNSLFTVGARGITGNPTFSAYAAAQAVSKSNTLGGS
jgi:hypothetical protein